MRNALARLHRVRLRAEIVQADLDFAAVIAVDDTDTVRDMNALFDAETAASENEARRARGDLRRKTARKYAALARLDRLRGVHTRAQVIARAARRRLLRDDRTLAHTHQF